MAPLQQRFDEDGITREEWAWVEDLIKDVARVEQHTRTSDDLWLLRELVGIEQTLQLQSIKHPLPLSLVYDKVVFFEP